MVPDYGIGVKTKPMTEVAVLQVYNVTLDRWYIDSVWAAPELAEQEASLRGYTRWSVAEFVVMGGE